MKTRSKIILGIGGIAIIAVASSRRNHATTDSSSASLSMPAVQTPKAALTAELAEPIEDHGSEQLAKRAAFVTTRADGERRALEAVNTALAVAASDKNASTHYVAELRRAKADYETRLRTSAQEQAKVLPPQ